MPDTPASTWLMRWRRVRRCRPLRSLEDPWIFKKTPGWNIQDSQMLTMPGRAVERAAMRNILRQAQGAGRPLLGRISGLRHAAAARPPLAQVWGAAGWRAALGACCSSAIFRPRTWDLQLPSDSAWAQRTPTGDHELCFHTASVLVPAGFAASPNGIPSTGENHQALDGSRSHHAASTAGWSGLPRSTPRP